MGTRAAGRFSTWDLTVVAGPSQTPRRICSVRPCAIRVHWSPTAQSTPGWPFNNVVVMCPFALPRNSLKTEALARLRANFGTPVSTSPQVTKPGGMPGDLGRMLTKHDPRVWRDASTAQDHSGFSGHRAAI